MMMSTSTLIRALAFLVLVLRAQAQCPAGLKMCNCFEKFVSCSQKRLTAIPATIPPDTTELILSVNPFAVTTLTERNFTGLGQVESLDLKSCGIVFIQSNAFQQMRSLKTLKLSNNKLKYIYDDAFRGLHLRSLSLDENKDVEFQMSAFNGGIIESLSIQKCGLSKIPFLEPLLGKLKQLFLENNKLEIISDKFKNTFSKLDVLGLSKNPLKCTCGNQWMAKLDLKRMMPAAGIGQSSDSGAARCQYPYNYRSVKLQDLMFVDYKCEKPQFGNIDVVMNPKSVTLGCNADSEDELQQLSWSVPGRELRSALGFTNKVTFNRSASLSEQTFTCLAKNLGGKVQLTVKVAWPPISAVIREPPYTPRLPEKDANKKVNLPPVDNGNRFTNNPQGSRVNVEEASSRDRDKEKEKEEYNFMTDRRFTLLELIGAVVGTFTGTLLFFVLTCQFVTWYKKREKKRWSTYGPAYSQTYSTPHSHEYDVPRIDQPCLPPTLPRAATSPLPVHNNMEFLDFHTGQRMQYSNNV